MPEEPSPPTRRRLNTDLVVAGSAVLISLCALGVSIYEAALMREQQAIFREQQKAAVWPFLEVGPSFNDDGLGFTVYNQGVGPARIEDVRVTLDAEPLQTWNDLLRATLDTIPGYTFSSTNERVVPAGGSIASFRLPDPDLARALRDRLGERDLGFALCYCSVYDDCWRIRDQDRARVEACAPSDSLSFQQ